ncbi:LamG-like jellyroll fold domain-containing protein [Haloferula sargassicola]|uniref:alpha-L-rhamnosidase n=1 Tax=Haloferula sargassicola TaxID=490096 RepID=A0ABP9USR7_9BACT
MHQPTHLVHTILALPLIAAVASYAAGSTLHQWHFDEITPPYADSGTGSPLPLSPIGSPSGGTTGPPGFGTCVSLPGSNDGLSGGPEDMPVANLLGPNHGTQGWTIEALVNFDSVTGAQREIVSMDDEDNDRPFQFVLSENGTRLRFHAISGGGGEHNADLPVSGSHSFVAGAWYHVAVSYSGDENKTDNLRIYWTRLDVEAIEANLIGSFSMTADLTNGGGDFAIGNELRATGGSSEGLSGRIDEVIISEGPKSATDFHFGLPNDDDHDGLPDDLEQQIIDADPDDALVTILDVMPDDDFDGDTLSNLQEFRIGTDPTSANDPSDLDEDRLPDAWETTYFESIFQEGPDGDPDHDGFSNLHEYELGTDPTTYNDPLDADADGLADAWEARHFGDLEQDGTGDFDEDGFSNAAEYSAGSYPDSASSVPLDMDSDGLSDDWERRHFGEAGSMADADPDGDGFDNATEQAAGSDPNDPADAPGGAVDPLRPSGQMVDLLALPHRTTIPDLRPEFTWIFHPAHRGEFQTAYQILVSSTPVMAGLRNGDVWDSGKVLGEESVNVAYDGLALSRGARYSWRVRTWGTDDVAGAWSPIQNFTIESSPPQTGSRTLYRASANDSTGYNWAGRYQPAFETTVVPKLVIDHGGGRFFIDFGRAGFGYLSVRFNGNFAGVPVTARFSEHAVGNTVVSAGGSTTNPDEARETLTLQNGDVTYDIRSPDVSGDGIRVDVWAGGVVVPFRYVELSGCPTGITAEDVRQHLMHVPFDEDAASFSSSDATLDAVWEMCRYSMKATSFAGIYVDGDRERLPYEADAYINQLGHYAVDREFATARYSYEWLLDHSTWPTEWKLHFPLMAWADYQYTGNLEALAANYDALVDQVSQYLPQTRADGILSHSRDNIVDWPNTERDGYVFTPENTVVNAFYYKSWRILADIAAALGKAADQATFSARADQLESSFGAFQSGPIFKDGIATSHTSAHANFFPLALGIEPPDRQAVVDFLKSKRMPCSVYASQYLLEALFQSGASDHAIGLLKDHSSTYDRHWWNMLEKGSTIAMEAWGNNYKSNQDWNHAWGAAPANIIPRYILGLTPLSPGFGTALIKPQLGTGDGTLGLTRVSGTVPTIRGSVEISVENASHEFRLMTTLPGNMTATVMIPTKGLAEPILLVDGIVTQAPIKDGWLVLENVAPGRHAIWLSETASPEESLLRENWKDAMFGNAAQTPSVSDALLDPDHDGASNEEEFIANTDPLDGSDRFAMGSFEWFGPHGSFVVRIAAKEGRRYTLERSTDLLDLSWFPVDSPPVPARNGGLILIDSSPASPRAFYRASVELP